MSNTLSYVHGASGQALIGQTIGRYFDEACARHAGRRRWWCATRTSA
jgi:fatty-acyl-CoA synthase